MAKSKRKTTIEERKEIVKYCIEHGNDYKNTAENNEMSNLKKQTRYTCKFVYIYDENEIGNNRNSFSISCPNCGAPLIGIGNYVCEYCSSQITPINLKTWKMSSYKEDYK